MKDKPAYEKKREFWERCGLKRGTCGWMYDPLSPSIPIFPPLDLNNLWRYAIPKLTTKNWKSIMRDWVDTLTGDYEKDALALFWVLDKKLMKEDKGAD